jgi:hypothetical protein
MAEICGFLPLRTSGSSAFGVDNGSRYHNALSAFRLAAERSISLARGAAPIAGRVADLGFPYGIANADDHGRSFASPLG